MGERDLLASVSIGIAVSHPRYQTIDEMLHTAPIVPQNAVCVGGPARLVASDLQAVLKLPVMVPADHGLTNAIGAALARPTMEVELLADTERGVLVMPGLGLSRTIDSRYSLNNARNDAAAALRDHVAKYAIAGADEQIDELYATAFNMITDHHAIAHNIRVRCQLRPGLIDGYTPAVEAP